MVRNILVLVCLLVQGGLLGFSTCLEDVALAQGDTDSSVLYDDFNDKKQGRLWYLYTDDADTCQMVETKGRLELQATESARDAFAGYVADRWHLDTTKDFAVRVDFHYDLKTFAEGLLSVGLTPDGDDPRARRLDFGVGCANVYPCYWYGQTDGLFTDISYVNRVATDGTIYISYDAGDDMLYLGDAGYGPDNAWVVLSDMLGDVWEGRSVYLYLGGSANGLEITSGHAYFDDLVLDTGEVIESSMKPVYRFWSPAAEVYLYTMVEDERDQLLAMSDDIWTYEGVAFQAYASGSDSACKPVYRFWSDQAGYHFYTMSEAERDLLVNEYAYMWTYEGPAFYAYPVEARPAWASPVYRFWSPALETHLFTVDANERDSLMNASSDLWVYEGIAWYTQP